MISFLRGIVCSKTLQQVLIDVNGIGYAVYMPSRSIGAIGAAGAEATIYTSMQIKDDSISLYGFANEEERTMFEKLITVSGVGPKVAISALSAYSAAELMQIITNGDNALMSKVPGIGKKTAQRIIIDLKGTFESVAIDDNFDIENTASGGASSSDAILALQSLGYSSEEAALAVKGYTGSDDVEQIIRYALKRMGDM